MKRARGYWFALAILALVAVGGMGWVTVRVCDLESRANATQRESAHRDTLRLALWRMDSWLNAQLAPEAARPWFHYRAYYSPARSYSRSYLPLAEGEVLTPSPLLTFRSELFPVHFQVPPTGAPTSPQLPQGNERDLADTTLRGAVAYADHESQLAALGPYLDHARLGDRLGRAARLLANCAVDLAPMSAPPLERDFRNRARQSVDAKNMIEQQNSWISLAGPTDVAPGALLPLWLDATADAPARLVFARRVDLADGTVFQGFAVDRDVLEASLRERVADLLPGAALRFERDTTQPDDTQPDDTQPDDTQPDHAQPDHADPNVLTTVPLRVVAPPAASAASTWSPTRTVLMVAWGALLVALLALAATLGSALAFGNRRARFASAVTHELRSPLTTFRMYAEMLAEDMVTDPAQRREYLATLCRESDRLGHLVENVLSYARIEDGRSRVQRQAVTAAALLDGAAAVLRRRAAEVDAGLTISVAAPSPPPAHTDPAVVEQILFALVDNACKYAVGDDRRRAIEVLATATPGGVEIRVRDHGPGIPGALHRQVFRPFERGTRPIGESDVPGVGLGLAVARGLAHELGGELTLDPAVTDGACFVLRLPAA